jgi:hypothetical protein
MMMIAGVSWTFVCMGLHGYLTGDDGMRTDLEIDTFDDLKRHAFLSYSQEDKEKVQKIALPLGNYDITCWIDYEGITPGTPDWEKSIRAALSNSFAFVLCASPHSRESNFVRAEVSLTQAKNIPIIPVWIHGDKWEDCIPLSLMYTQHIDLRDDRDFAGFHKLLNTLNSIIERAYPATIYVKHAVTRYTKHGSVTTYGSGKSTIDIHIDHKPRVGQPPRGYVLFILADLRDVRVSDDKLIPGVLFKLSHYSLISTLLDDVYMSFLLGKYPVLTYGEKWVLWSSIEQLHKIIVPWEWVLGERCNSNVWSAWIKKRASPAQCGVRAGEVYYINDPHRDRNYSFFAIGASDISTLDRIGGSIKRVYMYFEESKRGLYSGITPVEGIDSGLPYVVLASDVSFAREISEKSKTYLLRR